MFETPESLEQAFSFASTLALLAWFILIFLPRNIAPLNGLWRFLGVLPNLIIPILLSFCYAFIMLPNMLAGGGEGGFDSLAGVRRLFADDTVLLVGWIHYLAFDLLIGTFIAKKCDEEAIHRIIQAPLLAATFMFGPFGYLLFQIVRGGKKLFFTR